MRATLACAAACRSTRLRAPPTPLRRLAALQLAQQPPPRLQQRACSSVSGAGNGSEGELHRAEPPKPAADSAAAALVTLPSDRRRVAEWLGGDMAVARWRRGGTHTLSSRRRPTSGKWENAYERANGTSTTKVVRG